MGVGIQTINNKIFFSSKNPILFSDFYFFIILWNEMAHETSLGIIMGL